VNRGAEIERVCGEDLHRLERLLARVAASGAPAAANG